MLFLMFYFMVFLFMVFLWLGLHFFLFFLLDLLLDLLLLLILLGFVISILHLLLHLLLYLFLLLLSFRRLVFLSCLLRLEFLVVLDGLLGVGVIGYLHTLYLPTQILDLLEYLVLEGLHLLVLTPQSLFDSLQTVFRHSLLGL